MSKYDKEINFNIDNITFSEDEQRLGQFDGSLVNYNHEKLGHGIFKFKKGSMANNDGKTLAMMYNHNGSIIPVGTLVGKDSDDGFNVVGNFHLNKDSNGNYINPEAAKLYSLMKDMNYKFDMSTGGIISKFTEKTIDGKFTVEIDEFIAHEGSLTPKGAIEGSKVNNIFSEFNKKNQEEEIMDKNELKVMFGEMFAEFQKNMLAAQTDEEVKALPGKFSELETKFKDMSENLNLEVKEAFEARFNEMNEVIKGLKNNFTASKEDVSDAAQFMAMINEVNGSGRGVTRNFTHESEIKFADDTTNKTQIIKPTYAMKILERLQAANPVFAQVNMIPITDNSLEITREEMGLPTVAWVGETDTRTETSTSSFEDLDIKLYQIYALPKISNKLIATNYLGYINFLMRRIDYAWALKLSDTVFNGTGTKQPFGILNDTNVTQVAEIEAATKLADFIISTYYSVRSEIAEASTWYFRRETWAQIAALKNTQEDFYITDLNTGSTRTLMNRPVILIESDGSGIVPLDITGGSDGDVVGVFGDINNGMVGVINNGLNLNIKDQITEKGYTQYYMEKLMGFGVQLPERFTKIQLKK